MQNVEGYAGLAGTEPHAWETGLMDTTLRSDWMCTSLPSRRRGATALSRLPRAITITGMRTFQAMSRIAGGSFSLRHEACG
jgi:hypothetical protein